MSLGRKQHTTPTQLVLKMSSHLGTGQYVCYWVLVYDLEVTSLQESIERFDALGLIEYIDCYMCVELVMYLFYLLKI